MLKLFKRLNLVYELHTVQMLWGLVASAMSNLKDEFFNAILKLPLKIMQLTGFNFIRFSNENVKFSRLDSAKLIHFKIAFAALAPVSMSCESCTCSNTTTSWALSFRQLLERWIFAPFCGRLRLSSTVEWKFVECLKSSTSRASKSWMKNLSSQWQKLSKWTEFSSELKWSSSAWRTLCISFGHSSWFSLWRRTSEVSRWSSGFHSIRSRRAFVTTPSMHGWTGSWWTSEFFSSRATW